MRLSTILPTLAVICSVQVLAIPTRRSGSQSDTKSSLMDPQVESSVHQSNQENQSSESRTQDSVSSEENSPMDSADRIRKIVEAALATRRASKPHRRYYFTSNKKVTEGHEISETSNRKNDEIGHSNASMILTHEADQSINPVKSAIHMVKSNNSVQNIRKPHMVNNRNVNNKSNKAYNRGSESGLLLKNTPLPHTNTKMKLHQNMNIMSSSHTFSRLSNTEVSVPAITSKIMPSSQEKNKMISIKNRNTDFKTKTSDLSSTAATRSMPKLQISSSRESSHTFDNNNNSNLKFISPFGKRTEVGRNTQRDAIMELLGRHVLSSNLKGIQESYKTVSSTQYGSMVRSSSGSPLNKNVDKDMSSSEIDQPHRKNTTPILNTSNTMQQSLKSFRNIKPKKDMVQLEMNTNSPKAITENVENVMFSTTTEVHIPKKMSVDITEPIHVTENSDVSDMNESIFGADVTENIMTIDQIKTTLTNNNDYIKNVYQTPSNQNKRNQDLVIHIADAIESMKTSDEIQLTSKENYDNSYDAHQIPFEQNEGISEQVNDVIEREAKKSIINEALNDYSDVIGSLVDYAQLGTLEYDAPDEKPAERRDLSSMIVDLLFKVTGYNVR